MSKRYTEDEDRYLHHYAAVGPFLLARDMGRSEASVKARIELLKKCGAWDQISRQKHAELGYRVCLGLPLAEEIAADWAAAEAAGMTYEDYTSRPSDAR